MFYQSYSNILTELRQPAIFEPIDIGKSYIPQKKALNRGTGLVICFGLSFEELILLLRSSHFYTLFSK